MSLSFLEFDQLIFKSFARFANANKPIAHGVLLLQQYPAGAALQREQAAAVDAHQAEEAQGKTNLGRPGALEGENVLDAYFKVNVNFCEIK